MLLARLTKLRIPVGCKHFFTKFQQCHSVFGIKDLLQPDEKADNFLVSPVTQEDHSLALNLIKQYYLPDHIFVKARDMDIYYDNALDEYLIGLFKQGNSLLAQSKDGSVAGICVNFANTCEDSRNLRQYAFYRQDPNIKDFLYFTAKMNETPNLWNIYNQETIFEIRMLAVVPEFRRQGLAIELTERSIDMAHESGHNVVRIDCINVHDYKIAEHCMLHCIATFPLHKVRGPNAPFIKKNSEYNVPTRVFVSSKVPVDVTELEDFNRRMGSNTE